MRKFLPVILSILFGFSAGAQQVEVYGARENVRTSGDILVSVLPASYMITTLSLQDWEGLKQGAFTGALMAGIGSGLKYLIDKERPDKSNNKSFPSLHTGFSFAGATFIQRRYGWEWGIPAYAVATYVGWSRVYGKKHDWVDVTTGAALGIGCAYLFTRPYNKNYNPQTTNRNNLLGMTTGTAIGIGSAYILTKIFEHKNDLTIYPVANEQQIGLYVSLNF